MKHLNTFLATVALLLGFAWMSAETVENYSLDFNTTISTTSHDFKVAPGWKHIVGGAEDWWGDITYVDYTYSATSGINGSGALGIGSQSGTSTDNYDYLVTPAITGSVTMQVQLTSSVNSAGIKIFAIDEAEDGTLTVGDVLINETVATSTTLTQDAYGAVTVNGLNGQRIGIVGYKINLDDFVVTGSVEIEYEKALTITSAVSSETNGTVYCDTDNNYSFTYTITVKNTGECALAANDEGMFVGIANYLALSNPIATAPIGQALAIGDEVTVTVTANLNYADYPSRTRWDAIEGISGTSKVVTPWIEPIPYLPNISIRDENNHDLTEYPSYAAAFGSFGMINEATSKTLVVRNSGAAPGEVSITVPEGFTVEPATFTAAANTNTNVTVTLLADEPGVKSGDLVVSATGIDDVTLALNGTVLDTNKFFENFEGNNSSTAIPDGWYAPTGNWSKTSFTNGNNNYAKSALEAANKLITPLLHVTEGEKMTFEASKQSGSSSQFINVYYSTDRNEWTLVKELTADDMQGSYNNYIFNSYVVEGIPAGDYYIAFESGYCLIDNVYGFELVNVNHDLIITSTNMPSQAMANNDYTAKATLKNINTVAQAAEYTATLYFDGEAVATADAQEIAVGGTAQFEFTFVPNEVGTFPAYVKFTFEDGYTVTSDEVEVTITQESAENIIVVGNTDPTNSAWYANTGSYAVPICTYYNHSWSEALYTPAMLQEAGLTIGDAISSIAYLGYNPNSAVSSDIKVYILSTEAETMATFDKTDVTDLTPVFDGNYTFEVAGSSTEPIDLFSFALPEPMTWDGKALRIVVLSDLTTSYKQTYFITDSQIGGEIYECHNDYTATSGMVTSNFTKRNYFPVTKFGVQATPYTYSGVVKDIEGNTIEGATVTLKSQANREATAGQVVYTATTDADGKFSVEVIQTDKVYDATFSADGYNDETIENISLADGDVVLDEPVILTPVTYTGLERIITNGKVASVKYYNVAGNASNHPFEGVNIVVTTFTDGTISTTKVVK